MALCKPEVIVTGTAEDNACVAFARLEEISIKTAGPAIFAMPVARTSKMSFDTVL
jgi:hypothetical protein